ncbi:amino acid ABC transporter permease [Actinocorallia sp. A-T 12471]|uniref:amino acid ABC transporter permease n=1 Tax=Actinocorallia sp. A-T 12471 TaxID=3089813 RepID=UPI0029CD1D9E|nr:amino acid ABC transporter permease [Actinocorallia sp. A-T 12471]MDX6743457.1 amino acid ABC transporter permease [Actinocorallia sp. A-T 12471]
MKTPAAARSTSAPRKRARPTGTAGVLFDAPGPKARIRHNVLTLVGVVLLLLVAWFVWRRMDEAGQWDGDLWSPFLDPQVWTGLILPGLWGTLTAAAVAAVLALAFGVVFGLGRLSERAWIRLPSAWVVEFFRAIPVLIMIFSAQYLSFSVAGQVMPAFWAVVIGLTLYNGSVLAEVFRAGILAVPRGQSEAAYALGLQRGAVMRLVLLPQAVTAMLPAIVGQMVVLLKDTALGYIISYEDLLNAGFRIVPSNFGNLIPAAVVVALIYILINLVLGWAAARLEARSRRGRRSAAAPVTAPPAPGT